MRRLVTLFLAVLTLALPSAALAQSAGDEQYADPFGQVENPNGGQGQQSQQSQPPADTAPAPAQTTAPATPPATAADQAVASQDTAAPTLPRTGLNAVLFAVTGAALLLAGTTVRRLAS
jgi:hypothetical protein